jgi:uncharacterized membrane protein
MIGSEIDSRDELALFVRRDFSISSSGRLLVLGSLAFVTLAIAVGFAIQGAWLVLPFAGLECGALFLAFRWLQRHEDDYELIAIEGDSLVVEYRAGGKVERHEFNRVWVQVEVENRSPGRTTLSLRSHGREVEIGRLLSSEAKRVAARRIRARLSSRSVNKD